MDSRPKEALSFGQAGSSLRADSTGVWWSSMSYSERIDYAAFTENKNNIEAEWEETFGDRKNEIVFIGQDMDEFEIRESLEACLCTKKEIIELNLESGFADNWPLERFENLSK
jgi:G3E family GTPase